MDQSALVDQITQNILSKIDQKASIKIIDVTYKHRKHKSYVEGKLHFILEIYSNKLVKLNKIFVHRSIYKSIDRLMPFIHALSIKIKSEKK